MSKLFEGKDKIILNTISQLMYKGGVERLEDWLETVDQDMKDSIVQLIEQLATHLKEGVCEDDLFAGAEYFTPEEAGEHASIEQFLNFNTPFAPRKPALYLVKSEKSENNCK